MLALEQAREAVLAAKLAADAKAEVARLQPELKEAKAQHASCVAVERDLHERFTTAPSQELADAIEAAETATKAAALYRARAQALERAAIEKARHAEAAAPLLERALEGIQAAQQGLGAARAEHAPLLSQLAAAAVGQSTSEGRERQLRDQFLRDGSPSVAEEISNAERETRKSRLFLERAQDLERAGSEKVRRAEESLRQARLELDVASTSPEYLAHLAVGPAEHFLGAIAQLQEVLEWMDKTDQSVHQLQHSLAAEGVSGASRQRLAWVFERAVAERAQGMAVGAAATLGRATKILRNVPAQRGAHWRTA